MKPMAITSTPLVLYHDINVKDVDLFEGAWGPYSDFSDVIGILRQIRAVPEKRLTERLIEKIRDQD